MSRLLLISVALAALAGCPRPEAPCAPPRTYTVSGPETPIPGTWISGAWASAAARLVEYPLCPAIEGVEVWLRYHRNDPLLCIARPPYHTCTAPGHTPGMYYVEINLGAPGEQTVYDLLVHEFMHVLMLSLGAPSAQHHPAMRTSGWVIRRSARYVDPKFR